MNNHFNIANKVISTSVLAAGLCLSLSAQAVDYRENNESTRDGRDNTPSQPHSVVYTASNESTGNQVLAFDVNNQGRLTKIGQFDTRGTGTGAVIDNEGALATDAGDHWLFVTNSGDGTVTSFRMLENGLQFVNRIASGGFKPLSVTVFGTQVYVLNEGSGLSSDPAQLRFDNISGFRFTGNGNLVPIAGSTRIINNTRPTAPAKVGFNKSGTVLLVTEKATDTLTTYVMQQDGTPALIPLKHTSFVPTPFGFAFGDRDYVYVTEANRNGPGATSSYRVDSVTGAVSSRIDSLNQGLAPCWTVLSNDQTIGYETNTSSGTISLYRINFDGTMDYFFGGTTDQPVATGAGVRDVVLTQDNKSLVTLNNGDSQIRSFWVDRNGAIKPGKTLPLPASATGLIAR